MSCDMRATAERCPCLANHSPNLERIARTLQHQAPEIPEHLHPGFLVLPARNASSSVTSASS
jgi:hypothetical protein